MAFLLFFVETSRVVFCDFDQDFCQFSNDPLGELEWDRKQGPTFTDDTGPESDHTTGDPDGGITINKIRTIFEI